MRKGGKIKILFWESFPQWRSYWDEYREVCYSHAMIWGEDLERGEKSTEYSNAEKRGGRKTHFWLKNQSLQKNFRIQDACIMDHQDDNGKGETQYRTHIFGGNIFYSPILFFQGPNRENGQSVFDTRVAPTSIDI